MATFLRSRLFHHLLSSFQLPSVIPPARLRRLLSQERWWLRFLEASLVLLWARRPVNSLGVVVGCFLDRWRWRHIWLLHSLTLVYVNQFGSKPQEHDSWVIMSKSFLWFMVGDKAQGRWRKGVLWDKIAVWDELWSARCEGLFCLLDQSLQKVTLLSVGPFICVTFDLMVTVKGLKGVT